MVRVRKESIISSISFSITIISKARDTDPPRSRDARKKERNLNHLVPAAPNELLVRFGQTFFVSMYGWMFLVCTYWADKRRKGNTPQLHIGLLEKRESNTNTSRNLKTSK